MKQIKIIITCGDLVTTCVLTGSMAYRDRAGLIECASNEFKLGLTQLLEKIKK